MKSPNQVESMKLLKKAQEAIAIAREDLKNDEDLRDANLPEMLKKFEAEISTLRDVLEKIGYPKV